jgi:hypothetical protein
VVQIRTSPTRAQQISSQVLGSLLTGSILAIGVFGVFLWDDISQEWTYPDRWETYSWYIKVAVVPAFLLGAGCYAFIPTLFKTPERQKVSRQLAAHIKFQAQMGVPLEQLADLYLAQKKLEEMGQ